MTVLWRYCLVVCVCLVTVWPVAAAPTTVQSAPAVATQQAQLAAELAAFRPLADEALALRAETIKVGQRILADQQAGIPLRGADLALLNQGLTLHLQLRQRLLTVAEAHEPWLDLKGAQLVTAGLTPEVQQRSATGLGTAFFSQQRAAGPCTPGLT